MAYSGLADQDSRGWWGHNYSGPEYRKGYQYVILHHNAGTNFDAVPGIWRTRQASAHYQVGPDHIRVCLDEENVAWNAGNWDANTKSIAIENVDADTNWNIAPQTQENCARLVADICKRRGIPIDADHIKGHSAFSATSCPGRLDVNWVINRARELSGQPAQAPQQNTTPAPVQTSGDNRIYFDYRGNVREQPTTNSAVMRTYNAGTKMDYDGFVHGQNIGGDDRWLKTSLHKWYVHASVTGGTFGLKDLGSVNTQSAPQGGSQGGRIAQNGTFKANYNMKIRRSPSLSGAVAGTFTAGATQRYDSYADGDNYRFVSWIGASGNRNYVAVRNLVTGERFGICY